MSDGRQDPQHGALARPKVDRLLVQLAAAIHTRALYEGDHPQARRAVARVIEALQAALQEPRREEVTLLLVGQELVVDQRPLRRGGPFSQSFVETLKRRGVERLTLARGLTEAECEQLLGAMAGAWLPGSTAHVIVGRVEAATEGPLETRAGQTRRPRTVPALSPELVDGAREGFSRLRGGPGGGTQPFEAIVWSLMDALAGNARQMLALAPLRDHDEYLFVHSVNTSMLALAQGRALGIEGDALHALGLAALFHDVGKLGVPRQILTKPGKLDEAEWRVMRQHPEQGVWQLSAMPDVAPLCLVVCFEHHLRFDGQPSYPVLSEPRRPSLASQITAVADVYDALRTFRPYRGATGHMAALEVLKERAGTMLDPFLVGSFANLARHLQAG